MCKGFNNSLNCMKNEDYFPLSDMEGGWRKLENPNDVIGITGVDKSKLDLAFEYIKKDTKNGGLLIVKDGWLIYERYFGKGHREAAPNLASCGKSFTSIAMGILLSEYPGLFPDGLDQKVFSPEYLPPEAFPLTDREKSNIKLGQLLAFTGGIRGNNPVYVNGKQMTISPEGPDGWQSCIDAVAYGKEDIVNDEMNFSTASLWCKPGEGYSYATASIHLVSLILRHVTGSNLQEYISRHLAEPMNWGRWGYGYKENLAISPGGTGIALRSTDMLRFAYMLLHKGRWADRQLVPAEYVKQCSMKSPYNPHFSYSLQFNVNTDRDIPEIPEDAFWKAGSGGHCFFVIPSMNMVIFKLGGRDGQYSSLNTGLPEPLVAEEEIKSRENWVRSVDDDYTSSAITTLRLVISAVNSADC